MHFSKISCTLTLLFCILYATVSAQITTEQYLKQQATDLNTLSRFDQKNAKIIAFGAFHGSAKTEDAEILLLQAIVKNQALQYYFPETDYSIAFYFNEYLKTGDEVLLQDLVTQYGIRVPQERAIAVFEKWKKIKIINDALPRNRKITVLGADPIVSYKYAYRHIVAMTKKETGSWKMIEQLKATIRTDTTDYSPYYESFAKKELQAFVTDYNQNSTNYTQSITNPKSFQYLMELLQQSFEKGGREKQIFTNYLKLATQYKLNDKLQFFRYGFAHLLKVREGNAVSFLAQLIASGKYTKNEIVSITGYLTQSEVLWDDIYDPEGHYLKSTTEGDFGIGDADNEYFKGIENLKKSKVSDLTLFKINAQNSPYAIPDCSDLIEIITIPAADGPSYKNQVTTDFIDYALLISNSKANQSIYTLKKK